jgi:hypothetical protein
MLLLIADINENHQTLILPTDVRHPINHVCTNNMPLVKRRIQHRIAVPRLPLREIVPVHQQDSRGFGKDDVGFGRVVVGFEDFQAESVFESEKERLVVYHCWLRETGSGFRGCLTLRGIGKFDLRWSLNNCK